MWKAVAITALLLVAGYFLGIGLWLGIGFALGVALWPAAIRFNW